jgi:hypothetical protein
LVLTSTGAPAALPSSSLDLFARSYDAAGNPVGNQVNVNTTDVVVEGKPRRVEPLGQDVRRIARVELTREVVALRLPQHDVAASRRRRIRPRRDGTERRRLRRRLAGRVVHPGDGKEPLGQDVRRIARVELTREVVALRLPQHDVAAIAPVVTALSGGGYVVVLRAASYTRETGRTYSLYAQR